MSRRGSMAAPPEARIQSIGRAAALMDRMADGQWHLLRNLAAATGLAKTTAFNLVGALVDCGLAEHDPLAGAYRLSLRHVEYGRAVERRLDLLPRIRPLLIRLCAETRETVNLAVPRGTDALIVESLEGGQGVRVTSYAGTRAAYHATACGRALLAYRPEAERHALYALGAMPAVTSGTITDPIRLEALLAACRRDGYVEEREENEVGACCVAAPLLGAGGLATAAVSIAGPVSRMGRDNTARLGRLLKQRLDDFASTI
jgi:IclR family acetate operon transcriptional repressor